MELLIFLFRQLLSMALSALPVMAVVLLARCLLRQAPKKYSYWLWCVVGFRLVCPEAVISRSPWSIFNLRPLQSVAEATQSVGSGALPAVQAAPATSIPAVTALAPEWESGGAEAVRTALSAGEIALRAGAVLWLIGMAALLAYGAVSYIRLRRRMAAAVWEGGEVWACDSISTPFVMGFVRPRIYIPFRLDSSQRTYVLAHERYHIRRRDHWVKLLAYLILAVYWWNPGVWLCWTLFCRDMEMRCDEAVLAQLGDQVKKGYSLSLVSFALDRRAPMVLAFGEHDASRRVKNVLNWKRETPRVVFLAAALVVLVAAVCTSNGESRPDSWVRLAETGEDGEQTFTYSVAERYQSCLLYQEIYDHGVLAERTTLGAWSLGEDAGDTSGTALAREGTARLLAVFDGYGIQWSFGAAAADGGEGGAAVGMRVSGRQYSGMVWNSLCDNTKKGQVALEEDTAVAAAVLTEDTLHTFGIQPGTDAWMEELLRNDTAVVLRLRLSELGTAELKEAFARESGGLAQVLYDLRDGDIETLVTCLIQECPWELEPEQLTHCYLSPRTGDLFLMAEQAASGDLDQAENCALLLLALREDVSKVIFDVKLRTGSQETSMVWRVTKDAAEAAQDLAELGASETDIRRYGASPEALRALLAYLNWDSGAEADLAQTLYDLRVASREDGDGIRALVTALGGDGLGSYSLVWYEQAVEFAFSEPLSEQQVSEMWFTSQLLLALVENADQINYSFPAADNHITYYCDQEQADGWAQALGYTDIKDLGRSEAGIRALLAYLGMDGKASSSVTHTAQQMYELAQDDTPDALVDDLLCWDLWGDPSVEGTYIQTVQDGTLELVFQDTALWEEAMLDSGYIARNGCLILALRPELNTVWAGDKDKTSYTKVTRESAARILPEGKTIVDYGASPETLMELIALLEDPDVFTGRSIQKRADYQITLDPARWQLTEAQNGDLWQFAGEPHVGIEVFTMDPGTKPERLAQTYQSWNRSCVAAADLPLPEESPFRWALTAGMENGDHQEVYMTDRGDQAWHLVILNWDDSHADLLQELREITATFVEVDAETDTLDTTKPFTDILGYDGFISVESSNQIDWSNRTYYAVTGEETFPIAESFGWGDPQDYAVDLDGDGQEELVCNVTYGADGAQRVSIYQRRGDEIWRSWVTADGLPGYEREGVGSSYEEYDPVENVFRIHYRKAGQEDFAVAEVRGMAQLEEWYPYP